jgi:hypothetical protein
MAHFAKISENNIVLNIVAFNDSDMLDENGNESEIIGQQYLEKHNNWPANLWKQTSYNTVNNTHIKGGNPLRGNYAGIGFTWDPINNIFIPIKPFNSWILNLNKANWESPIGDCPVLTEEQEYQNTMKTHGWHYIWDEENISWKLTNNGPLI